MLPIKLAGVYTIVTDQIKGNTYALAEVQEGYSILYNAAHDPIPNFMTYKEIECYINGMNKILELWQQDY